MAKPYEVSLVSNTKGFVQGLDQAGDAVEGIGDSLDSVVREASKAERALDTLGTEGKNAGDKAGDGLERGITDGAKDSKSEIDKLENKFKDLASTAKRETADLGNDIDSNVKRGTSGAGEGLKDFKEESASTAKESAASFDGSANSIVDAFQEVAANAFIGFGPAGLAAGLALAAGIGLISAAVQQSGEDAEKVKEEVSNLTAELINVGKQGGPSLDYMVDRLQALATATQDGETSLKDLKKAADVSGSSFKDLAEAYAGNTDQLDSMLAKGKERLVQLAAEAEGIDQTSAAEDGHYAKAIKKSLAQEEYNSYLAKVKKVADEAAEADRLYALAGGPEMEAKAARISAVNEAYDDLAGSVDDYINKETGLFDIGAYLDAMHGREQGIRDYQDTLAKSALTPEAKSFLNDQGIEAAATFLQGYKAATPAQQAELNRIWSEAGKANSGTYGTTVKTALSTAFDGVQIGGPTVNANVKVDRRELDKVLNASYKVVVDAVTDVFGKKPR